MVERQDIDALLISALYGELTPADEKRLAAHFEAHPADRTVLADLTRAREVIRESRMLQVQLEPPAQVSSKLLQEAARRAPKASEQEGWFARFVRSFASHPAMAAAAMLVIVIGVAALVTRKKGDHFAGSQETAAPIVSNQIAPGEQAGEAASAAPAGAGSGMAFNTDSPGAPPSEAQDQYKVSLADKTDDDKSVEGAVRAKAKNKGAVGGAGAAPAPTATATPKASPVSREDRNRYEAKKEAIGAVELRKQDPAPKDFEETQRYGLDEGAGEPATGATAGMAFDGRGAGAPAAEPTAPTRPATTAAPPPPPAQPAKVARDDRAANERTVARPRAAGPADEKPADPQLAWAREQHAAIIAQVRANNCQNAARLAVALSNRAPDYYAQNVATDRGLKSCTSYIAQEREKDATARAERARAAQKRANEPAQTKPAPAKPTATERATDSK